MSRKTETTESSPTPELIGNRYQVEKTLGEGGAAVVFQVLDTKLRKKVALKQLKRSANNSKRRNITELFEYEYHVLSQLAHPRVIEVYDFGVDERGVFYTMELLDGGDLRELSPLPWRKTCSLIRDVCSALSLIHSRRQIHRDLTPRNIRCTRDEKAKLIDFGTMVPMGIYKSVVGTPPFTAPETLNALAMDARTDLYSVGATAYYALTRRNAYPARNFRDLRSLWQNLPPPPSRYVKEIPKELDSLVMSLISLDNMARPATSAEVIERLSAIASLKFDEQLLISKAYLSTPSLVDRDQDLSRVRRRIIKMVRGRGASVWIEGPSGVGRSRLLDACVLEGKLAGIITLRADITDTNSGNWGATRSIASQLLADLNQASVLAAKPHLSVLGHILPELLEQAENDNADNSIPPCEGAWVRIPSIPPPLTNSAINAAITEPFEESSNDFVFAFSTWAELWGRAHSWLPPSQTAPHQTKLERFEDPKEFRPRVQTALIDWIREITRSYAIIIAIDDLHQIDEPSASFFALLANQLKNNKLMLVATGDTSSYTDSASAIKLFRDASKIITLSNLDLDNSEKLLRSVFGDVPNIRAFANRLHPLSQGNPRTIMHLAQHAVDGGLVRYHAGAWSLPSHLDAADLPNSLSEALAAKVKALSRSATDLAQAFALSPSQGFTYEECQVLLSKSKPYELIGFLDELISAEIFSTDGQRYAFKQQGWISALKDQIDDRRVAEYHLALAEVFEKRGDQPFRAASHRLRGGECESGLSLLITICTQIQEDYNQNADRFCETLLSLPTDWNETLELALQSCKRFNRSVRDCFLIESVLTLLDINVGNVSKTHLTDLIDRLYRDSGLAGYHELDNSLDEMVRLTRALEQAQQRFDSSPESERNLAPADAIRALAYHIVIAMSTASTAFDYDFIVSLPSLKPFIPLSPALDVIDKNVECTTLLTCACYDKARRGYLALLDRIRQPDRGGLEGVVHRYTVYSLMNVVGSIETGMGIASALNWADQLDEDPLFQINAWRLRMMSHLVRGDSQQAERCRKQMELLQIQNSPSQLHQGSQILLELITYARADDLTGVKQTIPDIEKMVERYTTWEPALNYARMEYHRIRGDYVSALATFEESLRAVAPGKHAVWPYVADCRLKFLVEQELFQEVKKLAPQYIEEGRKAGLENQLAYLQMQLAVAEAKLGDYENAVRNSHEAIDTFTGYGSSGLILGLTYETRARVAIAMDNADDFRTYAQLCAEQYRAGKNPTLTAKYEKLMREARYDNQNIATGIEHVAEYTVGSNKTLIEQTTSFLSEYENVQDRMRGILDMIVLASHTKSGYLYTMREDGPSLSARNEDLPPSATVNSIVKNIIDAEVKSACDVTKTSSLTEESSDDSSGLSERKHDEYQPVILGHNTDRGFAITGIALLRLDPNKRYKYPADSIATISRYLLNDREVVPTYVSE